MSDADRGGRYSDLFDTGSGHAHDSNCAYCPICAAIGVLRNTKPEVLEHLAAAARELLLAAGHLLEETERVTGAGEPSRSQPDTDRDEAKVRRIDLG
jgi:hypothetical protein